MNDKNYNTNMRVNQLENHQSINVYINTINATHAGAEVKVEDKTIECTNLLSGDKTKGSGLLLNIGSDFTYLPTASGVDELLSLIKKLKPFIEHVANNKPIVIPNSANADPSFIQVASDLLPTLNEYIEKVEA